jgi:hypothetical protein
MQRVLLHAEPPVSEEHNFCWSGFACFSRTLVEGCSGGPKHHCVHFCTLELSGSANGKAVLGWLLTDLADVWEEHGVGLLQRLAVTDPGKLA